MNVEPRLGPGDDIATIVVRKTELAVGISFVDVLDARAGQLERVRDRILLPRLAEEPAHAIRASDESGAVTLLPAVGCIVAPLSRVRPEYRQDTDEFWVVVDVDVEGEELPVPDHLLGIGLAQACRGGASQLVGVVDSGVDASQCDATVGHFAIVSSDAHLTEPGVSRDCHHNKTVAPSGGWYHGSQVCTRIAGVTGGVAPQSELAVVAVLTEIDAADKRPKGKFHQFVIGISWLLTTRFRPEPAPLGCDVINASLSVAVGKSARNRAALETVLQLASAAEVLIVCAVGAARNPAGVPVGALAASASTLAVGALDSFHSFSSMNLYDIAATKPEICAPGPSTSLATPVVTGACALLLSATPALRDSAAALKQALLHDFSKKPVHDAPAGLDTSQLFLAGICPGETSNLDQLRGLPAATMVSLTIECRLPADRPSRGNLSFESYLREMSRVLDPLKFPIVTELKRLVGVDIVDVANTPFIVATAPASYWIRWSEPGGWIAQYRDITILSDIEIEGGD